MIVVFKTIDKKSYELELPENITVLDAKRELENLLGSKFPAERQRFIYQGKFLDDTNTISSYSNDFSKSFIVVIAPNNPTSPTIPEESGETVIQETVITSPFVEEEEMIVEQTVNEENLRMQDMKSSEDYDPMIQNIMMLGFSRETVLRALDMSQMDPDRAASLLLADPTLFDDISSNSNIDDLTLENASLEQTDMIEEPITTEPSPSEFESTLTSENTESTNTGITTQPFPMMNNEARSNVSLQSLFQSHPHLYQLRDMIQQDPSLLIPLLSVLKRTNPLIAQQILQSSDEFLQILNKDSNGSRLFTDYDYTPGAYNDEEFDEDQNTTESADASLDNPAGQSIDEMSVDETNGVSTLRISPEDKQSIDRLKSMGFSEYMVVQAFFACDRDENAAVEFLLSNQAYEAEEEYFSKSQQKKSGEDSQPSNPPPNST